MNEDILEWSNKMIESGIPKDHLAAMKHNYLESVEPHRSFYDYIGVDDTPTLIATSQINGINTGWITGGRSVHELFFSVLDNTPEPLKKARIQENYESLINNGIEYQYDFYQNPSIEKRLRDGLPKITYYEEDGKYFSGATHRTISAMMFNAPYMVCYLKRYKRCTEKYTNYLIYKEGKDKWDNFATQAFSHILIDEEMQGSDSLFTVLYSDGKNKIELFSLDDPIHKIGKQLLSNHSKVLEMSKKVEALILILTEIDNKIGEYKYKYLFLKISYKITKLFNFKWTNELIHNIYMEKSSYIDINDFDISQISKIWLKVSLYYLDFEKYNKM